MPISEKEKFLPTGLGKEAEPKETLPAVKVTNEVIWVNPDFLKVPLILKEGQSTKLGLFLTKGRLKEGFSLKVIPTREGKSRSGLLGQVIFKDERDRLYRDLDLKGAGYVFFGLDPRRPLTGRVFTEHSTKRTYGIFDKTDADWAKDMAEEFLKAGIRTERYLALIELKEIIDENKKISIKEAKKRGMMPEDTIPVVAVRAFGTKNRIEQVNQTTLEDARKMVAQEKKESFSWQDYLKWFAKNLGKNVGLMHKNGWYHRFISAHNITLDCRIVDLDSVESLKSMNGADKESKMLVDWLSAKETLNQFLIEMFIVEKGKRITKEEVFSYQKIFDKAYEKNLGHGPRFIRYPEPFLRPNNL